ncbi:MAG: hypothetical protein AAF845_07980 [Bacteroidota bacterium]
MPPLPEAEWTWAGRAAFVSVLVPLLVAVSPLMLLGYLWHEPRWRTHKARLGAGRLGDPLCTFARSFDRRVVDPWVVRAVWDELQDHLGEGEPLLPFRAGDRWKDDVWMHPDDLDDVLSRACRRSGHSLANPERNPWYRRVETVSDMVHFVNAQPRTEAV